jgi:hypothetical protein
MFDTNGDVPQVDAVIASMTPDAAGVSAVQPEGVIPRGTDGEQQ